MKLTYTKIGLKIFTLIALLSLGVFAQADLGAVRWKLTEINNTKVENSPAFIEIDQKEKRLGGNAGCNLLYGKALVKGKKLTFGEITTTKMFCTEPGVMKLEMDLTGALRKVTSFQKSGTTLNLYAGKNLILKFEAAGKDEPQETSSVRLEDKKWILEKIENNPLKKIEPAPFIKFDKEKGSAGGDTSCNAFGGNYETSGTTIKITGIISTMRACIEDERMNVERQFKSGLEKADRFEIAGTTLKLYAGKSLLLTFRGEAK